MKKKRILLEMNFMILTAVFVFSPLSALADTVSFSGYTFETNGDAALSGSALRLTPAQSDKSGSAFMANPVEVNNYTIFNSFFQFEINGGNRADGFAFVLQNDQRGSNALGGPGGKLGYSGYNYPSSPGISSSVAIEFDTWHHSAFDPDNNHIAIDFNGDVGHATGPHSIVATPEIDLRGADRYAWVDYNGINNTVNIYVSDSDSKPAEALITETFENSTINSQVYVGFTAGTGDLHDNHDIKDFSYSVAVAPEPVSSLLFVAGGATFALRRRFSKRKARD